MYQEATGGRLAPGQMRAVLADPATGTRQGRGVRGHIGVMPDLRAIVENTLRIVPDVYLRDSIGDTGAVPAATRICSCPDVLVGSRELSAEEAQRDWGQGRGNENDGLDPANVAHPVHAADHIVVELHGRSDLVLGNEAALHVIAGPLVSGQVLDATLDAPLILTGPATSNLEKAALDSDDIAGDPRAELLVGSYYIDASFRRVPMVFAVPPGLPPGTHAIEEVASQRPRPAGSAGR